MHKKKVVIAIPTSRGARPEVLDAIKAQTVPCDFIVHFQKPKLKHLNPWKLKSLNSTRNRNTLRWKLRIKRFFGFLKATHILWLDDDIVLPPNAIEEFLKQKDFYAQGGWCLAQDQKTWIAGLWIKDNVIGYFTVPETSLIKADLVSIACLFMKIDSLKIPFSHGINKYCFNMAAVKIYIGPCAAFCNSLTERKIRLFMNGSIICRHL